MITQIFIILFLLSISAPTSVRGSVQGDDDDDDESCVNVILYNSTYRYRVTETDKDCEFNEAMVRCIRGVDKLGHDLGTDFGFNGTVSTDDSSFSENLKLFPTYLFDKRHSGDRVTIRRTFEEEDHIEADNYDPTDLAEFEQALLECGERSFLLGERHDANDADECTALPCFFLILVVFVIVGLLV